METKIKSHEPLAGSHFADLALHIYQDIQQVIGFVSDRDASKLIQLAVRQSVNKKFTSVGGY